MGEYGFYLKNGFGEFKYDNGHMSKSQWKDDKKHSKGERFLANGEKREGSL